MADRVDPYTLTSTYHYQPAFFELYSLDLSKLDQVIARMKALTDNLGYLAFLERAKVGRGWSEYKDQYSNKLPYLEIIDIHIKKACQATFDQIDRLRATYGCDPFSVQCVVNEVFGVAAIDWDGKANDPQKTLAEREFYFNLMKREGLLKTNIADLKTFTYDPGCAMADYLKAHPETKALLLGCHQKVSLNWMSCFWEFKQHAFNHQEAVMVDLSSWAHVPSDFHSPMLWKGIPNEQFDRVEDHTHNDNLFNSPKIEETLKQIFRCLKPGGYLNETDFIKSEDKPLLERVGFTYDEKTKRFYKPKTAL